MQRKPSHRLSQALLAAMLLGVVLVSVSGCGGSQQSQQQASQSKARLDSTLQHAKQIGVPVSSLQPVIQKESQLSSTSAPFNLFNDAPATNYYLNQAKQYDQLQSQLQGIISTATEDAMTRAQLNMQHFQTALSKAQNGKVGSIQVFTQQYLSDQNRLTSAQFPKDYDVVSNDASIATYNLSLLSSTYSQLVAFHTTVQQMSAARLDVAAMQAQYQNDMGKLNTATTTVEFQNLASLIDAQYQMAVINSLQAVPFVGTAKLNRFKAQITLLKTYGMDASSYQQLYNADEKSMSRAKTLQDFLAISRKIDTDMASMQNDLTQGAANWLIGELDRQANAWGQANLYHDKFDGKNYIPSSGYTMNGIGYWLKRELSWAWQPSDYQAVVDDDNNEFFNFKMFQMDYADRTPYNQVHQSDLLLMQHYPNLQRGVVLMISMAEQALRYYKDGKLVRSFLITMGRVERPTLPGYWTVQDRKSPTQFKSSDPPGSPYWYPPTPINYAILYHWGGYFIHDSWWRADYGPGTQYPHYDSGGDQFFSGNGSHGCVNMRENDAAWVYANTDWNTQVMLY